MIIITGPTASCKTRRAVDVALRIGGEIISADSRQVYRGMDIGTGKDLSDYPQGLPVHMLDVVPSGYKYNLYEYLRDARSALNDIESRGREPIVCGGTGLYVESLLNGISLPEVPRNDSLRRQLQGLSLTELTRILAGMKSLHNTTDVDTAQRAIRAIEIATFYQDHPDLAALAQPKPRKDALVIVVDIPRDRRRRRISERLRDRISQGMIDEVRSLLASGIPPEDLIYYGLEYKFITLYLIGSIPYDEMLLRLEMAIHQFAKRQMTWFRGMERRGHTLHFLPWDMDRELFVDNVIRLKAQAAP